ncbi:hypothetical protein AB0F81_21995 [Actinoplanes sp. NPDC024001]|uniref:hypothetical protein n=1 Tax=Actinoplanes sp. NPDC024001 TaxID=3154598 RepID=UPI0033FB4AD1
MIEFAAHDVIARRESLAGRVRDALAIAGLPIVAPDMDCTLGRPGAEVRVDKLADAHAPVRVEWHPDRVLQEAFLADQADAHYLVVLEGMLRVITEILTSAGFPVRDSTNDFAPFTLEVLGAPPDSAD